MITGVGIDLEGTRGDLTAYENALYLDLSDYMGVYIHKKSVNLRLVHYIAPYYILL